MAYKNKYLYFFLNGELHKKLYISRPRDIIVAWCYPRNQRITYTYSDVIKKRKPAYTTKEAAKMVGRSKDRISLALWRNELEKPARSYPLDGKMGAERWTYRWSEEDIIRAHDYFLTVHRGRPRKDEQITPQAMPTKREIRAVMRNEEVVYVQDSDGEFRPIWRAQDFS